MVEKEAADHAALLDAERLNLKATELARCMASNLTARLAAAQASAQQMHDEKAVLEVRPSLQLCRGMMGRLLERCGHTLRGNGCYRVSDNAQALTEGSAADANCDTL